MQINGLIITISAFFLINSLSAEEPLTLNPPVQIVKEVDQHLDKARRVIQGMPQVKDSKAVMQQYGSFAQTLKSIYISGEGLIEKDVHRIIDAALFAAAQHRYQTRKDTLQTPYIVHPLAIATTLMDLGHVRDPDIIIAALLHDTVEDTDTSFEMIRDLFGTRVEGFVKELTDDKSLSKEERKRLQIENASHKSAGAAQVKLADKLYNMSDVAYNPPPDWDQDRRDNYIKWGQEVVSRLPWVNEELLQAVNEVIVNYWKKQKNEKN